MLCKDDYVNYGTEGICKIEDIRSIRFGSDSCEKKYYILKPIHQEKAHVFVPIDNPKLLNRMRPILSPEEIDRTILSISNQKMPWINDRKERLAQFQKILLQRDERELLLLVRCLFWKSKQSVKGLSSREAQVLKKAESIISQEFSFSLKISPQDIGDYIRKETDQANTTSA